MTSGSGPSPMEPAGTLAEQEVTPEIIDAALQEWQETLHGHVSAFKELGQIAKDALSVNAALKRDVRRLRKRLHEREADVSAKSRRIVELETVVAELRAALETQRGAGTELQEMQTQLARKDHRIRKLKRSRDDADAAHKAEIEALHRERDAEVRRRIEEGLRRGFPGMSDALALTPAATQPQQSREIGAAMSVGATQNAAQQLAAFRAEWVAHDGPAAADDGGGAPPEPEVREPRAQVRKTKRKPMWVRVLDYDLLARLLSAAIDKGFEWKGMSALVNHTTYSEVPDSAWTSPGEFEEEYPCGRTRLPCLVKCAACQWRSAPLCFHPPTVDEPWRLPDLLGDDDVVKDSSDRSLDPREGDGRKHNIERLALDAIEQGWLEQADLDEATSLVDADSGAPRDALDMWYAGAVYRRVAEAFSGPGVVEIEGSLRYTDGYDLA
ncbi:unnamed protein product [Pedinophyceae sp. YPF-701]|nr:unnamed protein product [Pedinophyceae sp. YPF-701]